MNPSDYFDYSPETGVVTRKSTGRPVGTLSPIGYLVASTTKKHGPVYLHRVAWELYTGNAIPKGMVIDHINFDKTDNRISNLRIATHSQNITHRSHTKKRRLPIGAHYCKELKIKKYKSSIVVDGKSVYLGHFATAEEASEAYKQAAKIHHKEFMAEQVYNSV